MKSIIFGFFLLMPFLAIGQIDSAHLQKGMRRGDIAQSLPIAPARTISISTDEGSYMDVDVSPNGKTLAFDLLGELFTVPSAGGKATQLTRGLPLNVKPVWSPDGRRIAYFSDYSGAMHLNVRDLTGKFHLVLGKSDDPVYPTKNLVWTGDGHFIAETNPESAHVYSLSGGKTPAKYSTIDPLRFSADGAYMYAIDSGWVWRYDYKSGNRWKIAMAPKRKAETLRVSPDGHWMAYIVDSLSENRENGKRSLVVEDLWAHTLRVLVPSLMLQHPYLPKWNMRCDAFSFSPDSRSIYIGYGGKIHRIGIEDGKGQIIPFTADVKIDLGRFDYHTFRVTHDSLQVRYARSASKSPDGKHLVFMALNRIYVRDLPNGKPRLLVPQLAQAGIGQFQPAWSPDGKWIAFVSWCDTLGGYLWKVKAEGGEPMQLTDDAGEYQRPCWSPDGNSIAYVQGKAEITPFRDFLLDTGQLKLLDLPSRVSIIIDGSVPLWNQVGFSLDGTRIIYHPKDFDYSTGTRNDSVKPRLVFRDLRGENQVVLAIGGNADFKPQFFEQRSISPDGRFAVYSYRENEELYLVPIYPSAAPAMIFDRNQHIPMIQFAAGVDPHWEEKGKLLAWTYGNQYYQIDPDKIIAAAETKIAAGYPDAGLVKLSIQPDLAIPINLKVPTLYGHGTIALKNVRILTMQGNKVIERGTIVIKDGRFVSVGPSSVVQIPSGAKVMDLQGKTIMPGMIDMHLHLGHGYMNIFSTQRQANLANLAYGVTTGRDPASTFESFGNAEVLSFGAAIGPRLFTVARAIFQYSSFKLDDPNDALAIARQRILMGGTAIKQYDLRGRFQKQWLLKACEEAGLNMTNEGHDFTAANTVLEELSMIKDGSTGVEHNPDFGDTYKDVTTFYAKSGSYLGETLGIGYGPGGDGYFEDTYWRRPEDAKMRRFSGDDTYNDINAPHPEGYEPPDSLVRFLAMIDAAIIHQGGKVTLGSHGDPEGIGAHITLWALKMGGLTNMETLQAATIVGAEALGMQRDLGSIEVGKIADLIVLNKNPLDDIHNSREINYVMKDGVLYDGDTLGEIWPEQKKGPEWRLKTVPDK